ncbi:hypothetical protein O181_132937 [Austropuccinia psidii MF-1]|uniref:Uncharacterized protein n=1 Tax=Austropuccinia psidii MF-1 TaxID=1389203 RepID=A0A9Q3L7Y5_9BASI|nr:hypothetical protein [Austropuccinia psidii MF-1]
MPPYAWRGSLLLFAHKSLHLSRIPTLHTQILTPNQDPDASHVKPCAVNPYAGAASHKCQKFLMLVQAPNTSHTNPYPCTGSQIFKLDTAGKPPDNSNTSLHLCRLPMLHTQILTLVQVPEDSNNSLLQCRLPTLHTQILTLLQVPNASHTHPHACTGS